MLTLNGTSQYLEAGIVTTAIDNITMEAWVYQEATGVSGIIYQGHPGSNGYGIRVIEDSYLAILCGGASWLTSTTELPVGSWHHVAAVRDNGTWKLYLDGVEQVITNENTTPNTPVDRIFIGANYENDRMFNGKIDEVRVWNVARSESEIRASYGSLAGTENGLTAYWRLDEGEGSTAGDSSGNDNTATLIGSPVWEESTAPVSAPEYHSSHADINFGVVGTGFGKYEQITITNTGGGILHITSVESDNNAFTVDLSSANIFAADEQKFLVGFEPPYEGVFTGELTLTHNPGNSTQTISLSGRTSPLLPEVTTLEVTDITTSTAIGHGDITLLGIPNPTQHGVCWSTDENPTIDGDKTEEGSASETGVFTSEMTGLTTNTTYYVRAYATNDAGTSYGEQRSFTTAIIDGDGSEENPYQIATWENLKWLSETSGVWDKYFIQTDDITNPDSWFNFSRIGNSSIPFSGNYNGNDHTISNLRIEYNCGTHNSQHVGFFRYTSNAVITNLGLINVSVRGFREVGGLIGRASGTTVHNCFTTGHIKGIDYNSYYLGGLIGKAENSTITDSYSSCDVYYGVTGFAGGLIGRNISSTVTNCHATGNINVINHNAGGLIGHNIGTSVISRSYSTGSVVATNNSGGLVGWNEAVIKKSYSIGNVTGRSWADGAGGLVGRNENGSITNCYATGSVNGSYSCGGLVGNNHDGSVSKSYSTGAVNGSGFNIGGLVGANSAGGSVTYSFWDMEASGMEDSSGGTGKTTRQMQTFGTFANAGWDFVQETINGTDHIWGINDNANNGYPFLAWQDYVSDDVRIWMGTDNNWTETANWSAGILPGDETRIAIGGGMDHYPVITGEAEVKEITIATTASLTISPTGVITVSNSLINEANEDGLIIQQSAAGKGSLLHTTEGVKATAEQYFPTSGQGWHFLSSPVSGMDISGSVFHPGAQDDFYLWDESGWWINFKAGGSSFYDHNDETTHFVEGRGYLVSYQNSNDPVKKFRGALNTGTVTYSITHSGLADKWIYQHGWNLIGNPYPSPVDWNKADRSKFEDNTAYVYDPEIGGGGGYSYIIAGPGEAIVPQNQGFFVLATEPFEFTFHNEMRVAGPETRQKNQAETPPLLGLKISGNGYYDVTTIRLFEQSCFDRDRFDALKLFSFNNSMPQLYSLSKDRIDLAVNSLPEITEELTISLGMSIPSTGAYRIGLDMLTGEFIDYRIYLADRNHNLVHDLIGDSEYIFVAEEGMDKERFEILFYRDDGITGIHDPATLNPGKVWYHNNSLYVEAFESRTIVSLYDITGRKVGHWEVAPGSHQFLLSLQPGVYSARISARLGVRSVKLVIH
ncbi:MAG: LamG-like jellyroll fold domain-containing protein [Bacteroidales bacterium]|nr:LamG-like jellyroll fold domain-containing protein [Bacteroidales bacterium]